MSAPSPRDYVDQVNLARRGGQPLRQPRPPIPRATSPIPGPVVRSTELLRPSSPPLTPAAASAIPAAAFPVFDESEAAGQEPSEPLQTRRRSRAVSFREADAVQTAQLRTARNAAANASQAPTSPRLAPRRSVFREEILAPSVSSDSSVSYIQPLPMPSQRVPKPGAAKLKPGASIAAMLEKALQNKWLPEWAMKFLCEECKKIMMEESNIQPVSTPVTVCGDLHGQFYDLLELFRVAGGIPTDEDDNDEGPSSSSGPSGPSASRGFTSDDIEPPTKITDPKLQKKMKNLSLGENDEPDAEEENRGRSRDPVNTASLGPYKEGNSGIPGNQNYIFLGDFVDRGYFSLETLTVLLCLKVLYPGRVTLIRGNHESRQITQVYGFYEECNQKYGNSSVWKACTQVFDFMALGAVIDGRVLCVHGGLSPEIRTIDQIRVIARAQEIPHEGAFCDLVWSDPEDIGTWAISPRGAGWLFGDKIAREFNHVNGLELIARAHQLVNEGYKWHFEDKSVITVWSAPNYCYRCGNVAAIMNLGEDIKPRFSIFSAVPDNQRRVPASTGRRNDYFL